MVKWFGEENVTTSNDLYSLEMANKCRVRLGISASRQVTEFWSRLFSLKKVIYLEKKCTLTSQRI